MLAAKFNKVIKKIRRLEEYREYIGAFVFGSFARGEIDEDSDLDVKIITTGHNSCLNLSHPVINGVKLDISFCSFDELKKATEKEKESSRIPMLAESLIIFDKHGFLSYLKDTLRDIRPKQYTAKKYNDIQFIIYHTNNKVARNLKKDRYSSLLSMYNGLGELIRIYYKISGRWRVSDKRLLEDLDLFDPELSGLIRQFLAENILDHKFTIWSGIIKHILKPIGRPMKIKDICCECKRCKKNLKVLQA